MTTCPCGLPLHYQNSTHQRWVEKMVSELGETILVTVPGGSWYVPRHYIALHGIKADHLREVAEKLHFKEWR